MKEKEEVIEVVEEKEYILDGTNTYCLYDNVDQDNLLAMAYSEEQLKEVTKYYASGVWFEFDNVFDNNIILNERKYSKKVRFPKEPLELKSLNEIEEDKKVI